MVSSRNETLTDSCARFEPPQPHPKANIAATQTVNSNSNPHGSLREGAPPSSSSPSNDRSKVVKIFAFMGYELNETLISFVHVLAILYFNYGLGTKFIVSELR